MKEKKEKIIALVGDYLSDANDVMQISKLLSQLGCKCLYYKDVDENSDLLSVIILFNTRSTYGFDVNSFLQYSISKRVPVIAIYTDVKDNEEIHDSNNFSKFVTDLWQKIPAFEDEHYMVPTVHILLGDLNQIIKSKDFYVGSTLDPSDYYLLHKYRKQNEFEES